MTTTITTSPSTTNPFPLIQRVWWHPRCITVASARGCGASTGGEVQGILTGHVICLESWQGGGLSSHGEVAPSTRRSFLRWDGFTAVCAGTGTRMAFWSSLLSLVSPLLSQGHIINEGMERADELAPFFLLLSAADSGWGRCRNLVASRCRKVSRRPLRCRQSMRLFIGQHKIQHDLEFRQVYECTRLTVVQPRRCYTASLNRDEEDHDRR